MTKFDIAAQSDGYPLPLYYKIYMLLRDGIMKGVYPHQSLLPSEQEISKQFSVSRITAKRALDELAAEGMAVRQRGKGTQVNFQQKLGALKSSVDGLLENLLDMGLKTSVKLIDFAYEPSNSDVATALQIPLGAIVQRAVRVRSLQGSPFSHLTTYVPEAIGRRFSRNELSNTALLALLERCGVKISSAEQTITATLADNRVTESLQVAMGSPLLRISRVVFDQNKKPVEFIQAIYRPDLYEYRMRLDRVQRKKTRLWSPTPINGSRD